MRQEKATMNGGSSTYVKKRVRFRHSAPQVMKNILCKDEILEKRKICYARAHD